VRCQVAVADSAAYGVSSRVGDREPGIWEPAAYRRTVPRLFDHLRETLGDEVELLHDVHERLPPIDAIGLAKDLERHQLFFLEDPFAPEDAGYLRLLRRQTATPIALGELFVNQAEYVPLVGDRLIDFVRAHVSSIGGLTVARKLAALCEFYGVRTAWHGPGDVSPIGHAANLHLDLACPNFGIQEQHIFDEHAREVFPGCLEIREGHLWPNERPGLGVDVNEKFAAEYPFPEDDLNGGWAPIRRADGTVIRP
jgi:mannonate dehydratase